MKLAIGMLSLCLICGTYAETKNEVPVKSERTKPEASEDMKIDELPKVVQEAVKKECQGKITAIKKVKINKDTYYKVTAEMDDKKTTYVFDSNGKKNNTIKQ